AELISTQTIQLFGNYWQEIVVPYGWLPAIVTLLKEYLTTLEVDDLKHTHTKMVLQNILESKPVDDNQEEWERVRCLASSWNNLGACIDRPEQRLKLPVLRRVSEAIETILDQCHDADKLERRAKIASKLTPLLVEVVMTEEELGRVLDHLGPVLGDPRTTKEDEKLTIRLLLSMAKQIGDLVKQTRRLPGGLSKHESLLVRVVPYVKVALPRVRDAYETNRTRAE